MPKAALRRCRWRSKEHKAREIRKHLRAFGDGVPQADLLQATRGIYLDRWETMCDHRNKLVAAMRWTQNDWYLCTLKNAAVSKSLQGRGIGSRLYKKTAARALRNRSCLVLAADVNYDNIGSKKPLEKLGFKPINRFCWKKGQKAADILHFVKLPASGTPKHPRCK